MLFSEEELIAILSRHLPKEDKKNIESAAKSIIDTSSNNWNEVTLHEDHHAKEEQKFLHDICHKHAQDNRKKKIKLFYKPTHPDED